MSCQHFAEAACRTVAPVWPLDRLIAINPWWGRVSQSIYEVGATLWAQAGVQLVPRPSEFKADYTSGKFSLSNLEAALNESEYRFTVDDIFKFWNTDTTFVPPPLLLSSNLDTALQQPFFKLTWEEAIVQQISQFCASYFDADQSLWSLKSPKTLFSAWHKGLKMDRGVQIRMNAPWLAQRIPALPSSARELIAKAVVTLNIPESQLESYFSALLLSVNGWASWCSFEEWQAKLDGGSSELLIQLLAIRLAWELLLDDGNRADGSVHGRFLLGLNALSENTNLARMHMRASWICLRALEIAYQKPLCIKLSKSCALPLSSASKKIRAFFCIDVRSEVFRRHLESSHPEIETSGFAGFFGLPIGFTAFGSNTARPHLPGLISPSLRVREVCKNPADQPRLFSQKKSHSAGVKTWKSFQNMPTSVFTFVETWGLFSIAKLLQASFAAGTGSEATEGGAFSHRHRSKLRPVLESTHSDPKDDILNRIELAEKALNAMNLTPGFGRLVVFIGHGSQTTNNPQASALECGACGGQTGEVNSRVLASLLNNLAVQVGLASRGIHISEETVFLAALHNTTTDEISFFDTEDLPSSHTVDFKTFESACKTAGHKARSERAPALDIDLKKKDHKKLLHSFQSRAKDWSQVRPEWGSANNASFVIAQRSRTQSICLDGRAFLHDYNFHSDPNLNTLELIMTAPMIVGHWINMQYYASTVCSEKYGSGNKVLHNVVCGKIGVFEGNSGDLRIGLPLQSVHNGTRWMHTPLRLSVFIEAPQAGIDSIIKKHEIVQNLFDNGWINLFQIDEKQGKISEYRNKVWNVVPFSE